MKTINTRTFDQQWDAQSYAQYGTPQFNIAMEALSQWKFNGNESILDIGCGNGAITSVIADKYAKNGSVMGVDLSQDMVNLAKQTFKAKNLSFRTMDAAHVPFVNEFDLVSSFYCLHWVKDQQSAINGIFNSLKENGQTLLYIMTNPVNHDNFFSHLTKELAAMPKWSIYLKNYQEPWNFQTKDNFKKILDKSGFKTLSLEHEHKQFKFKDQSGLNAWLNAIPFAKSFPKELHDDLINDIALRYLSHFPMNEDKSINFALPTLVVTAQKI